MIILDDLRSLGILSVICVVLIAIVWWVADATEPTCPAGSVAKYSRGSWYCVVPPVKP